MSFLDSVSNDVCSGWPLAALLLSYSWQTVFWALRGGQQIITLVEGSECMNTSHGDLGPCDRWLRIYRIASVWMGTFIFLFLGI